MDFRIDDIKTLLYKKKWLIISIGAVLIIAIIGIIILLNMGNEKNDDTNLSSIENSDPNSITNVEASIQYTWNVSATENDHVTATLYENGNFVINGTGKMIDYEDEAMYYKSRPYYSYLGQIVNVIVDENVTNVGRGAFYKCTSVVNLTIKNELDSLGNEAFFGCNNLRVIDIQGKVRTIDAFAFSNCDALNEIKIPDGVVNIRNSAFKGCKSLTSVYIPTSIANIESSVFSNCAQLSKIDVDANNSIYNSRDLCNAIIETQKNTLIAGCLTTKIPETVTAIADYAFEGCQIEGIKIPKSVKTIGVKSFAGCTKLKEIEILGGVEQIGDNAFDNCDLLVIHGENGSTAQKYAQTNNIQFTEVEGDGIDGTTGSNKLISDVTGNPTTLTNKDVVLTVHTTNEGSESAKDNEYSFDNGQTWQKENSKKYSENINGIIVKVKDKAGSISVYDKTINIDKIDKTKPTATITTNKDKYYEGETVFVIATFDEDIKEGTPTLYVNGEDKLMTRVDARNYTYSYVVSRNTGTQVISISSAMDLAGNTVRKNANKLFYVEQVVLNSISITTPPNKTSYTEGEDFDSTGMVITAVYNNGTTKEIRNFQVLDGNDLMAGRNSVSICYTEKGVTKVINQAINVTAKVDNNYWGNSGSNAGSSSSNNKYTYRDYYQE